VDGTSTEGEDGVFEGTSEGEGTPPSTAEGADGVYEGTGEGTVAAPASSEGTPSTTEGADGTFEGTGEGTVAAPASEGTPSTTEGADGTFEGTGEGTAPAPTSRRLLAEDEGAASTATATWFWTKGHSGNQNSLIPADALAPPEGEGEGSASRRLHSKRSLLDVFPVLDANETPIEMVVGKAYKLQVTMPRATKGEYFSAPALFAASTTKSIEDSGSLVEMHEFMHAELYPGVSYYTIYISPKTVGEYTVTSRDDGTGFEARINVVADMASLTNPTTLKTHDISADSSCTPTSAPVEGAPPGAPMEGASAPASGVRSLAAGLIAAVAAVAALLI